MPSISMTICKSCGKPLKWFKDPVNEKWIPLETNCNLEYESPEEVNIEEVNQWRHKCAAALTCNCIEDRTFPRF